MKTYQWYGSEAKPAIVTSCIEQVKSKAEDHVLVPVDHGKLGPLEDKRCESNILRCMLLRDDPSGMWIDTDTEIDRHFIPPADGKVYISQGRPGLANGDVIIANGNSKFFQDMLDEYDTLPVDKRKANWMEQMWAQTSWKDRYVLIPEGYYRHLALCHTKHLREGQVICINRTVMKKVNGELVVIARG